MTYVTPCYWEQGYCEGDLPCETYDAASLMSALVFDRTVQDAPLTLTRVSTQAVHIRRDTGKMYFVEPTTGEILQWDGDEVNRLPFEWKSRVFLAPKPMNFSFAQVILDDLSSKYREQVLEVLASNASYWDLPCASGAFGDVDVDEFMVGGSCIEPTPELDSIYTTLYVYADGVLRATLNVLSEKLYRLPGGFRATRWEVEVVGNKGVRRITLATSAAEIAAQ